MHTFDVSLASFCTENAGTAPFSTAVKGCLHRLVGQLASDTVLGFFSRELNAYQLCHSPVKCCCCKGLVMPSSYSHRLILHGAVVQSMR